MNTTVPQSAPSAESAALRLLWRVGRTHHVIGSDGEVACSQVAGRGEFIRSSMEQLLATDRRVCNACLAAVGLPHQPIPGSIGYGRVRRPR